MSNARDLRKKIARQVEDELFTIQTSVDNFHTKINATDFKALKKLSYWKLKELRECIGTIQWKIEIANRALEALDEPDFRENEVVQGENGQEIFVATRLLENNK